MGKNLYHQKIKNFPFQVPGNISRAFRNVQKELNTKNINLKLEYYISDEWFVADGQTSIAIPFYLCDQKIKNLEKKYLKKIEEKNNEYIEKIIRHEVAHCLDNAFNLRLLKKRQSLFGLSSTSYPMFYYPNPSSVHFVENLEDNYAQSHPEEDWAETFAVWLNPKIKWSRVYQSKALEKLVYLDSVMRTLNKRKCKISNLELGSYKFDSRTFASYFSEKSQNYKVKYKLDCLAKFKNIPRVINPNQEQKLYVELRKNFNLKEYEIKPLYNAIKKVHGVKYSSKRHSNYNLMQFTDILLNKGTKKMFSEFHKVIV